MNKKIEIFTSKTCRFCHDLKEFLDNKNIQYEEKEIGPETPENIQELRDRSGQLGVPVMFVEGVEEPIVGFDENKVKQVLEIE